MENEDNLSSDTADGFMSDLTNSIPGIDEAMSFAEMLKYVLILCLCLYWYMIRKVLVLFLSSSGKPVESSIFCREKFCDSLLFSG